MRDKVLAMAYPMAFTTLHKITYYTFALYIHIPTYQEYEYLLTYVYFHKSFDTVHNFSDGRATIQDRNTTLPSTLSANFSQPLAPAAATPSFALSMSMSQGVGVEHMPRRGVNSERSFKRFSETSWKSR